LKNVKYFIYRLAQIRISKQSRAQSAFIKAQESPPYGPGNTHFSGLLAQAKKG
jgi:hypothetical protein